MPVKGLPSTSQAPAHTRIQLEIVDKEMKKVEDQPPKPAGGDSAAVVRRGPREFESPARGYEASGGRAKGKGLFKDAPPPPPPPADDPDGSSPAPIPPASTAPSTGTPPTATLPTLPKDKGPRVRIQLEIARDAGLASKELETETPKETSDTEASSSSSSGKGTTIQNQLLLNGAGFTTGLRDAPKADTSSSTETTGSTEPVEATSYQTPTQLLQEYYAQQALSSLTGKN